MRNRPGRLDAAVRKPVWAGTFYPTTAADLSRRIDNQAGKFAGVLIALIDPMFFYERYQSYLNLDVDALLLLDARGTVLAGWFEGLSEQRSVTGQ